MPIKCEQCAAPATAEISYQSYSGRRIYHNLCQQHGRDFWAALAAPLRETVSIEKIEHAD